MTQFLAIVFCTCLLGGCHSASTPVESTGTALGATVTETTTANEVLPFRQSVEVLNYRELAATYSLAAVDRVLDGRLASMTEADRRAAATLVSIGALTAQDLDQLTLASSKLEAYVEIMRKPHSALLGRVGDVGLLKRLRQPLHWDELLGADAMLDTLGKALSDGVLTGYDLRKQGVYDALPASHTLIYSHSDLAHLRQLVVLLHRESVEAWVYLTPKVSAFLYREDWGGDGENLATLPGGARVIQGREMAVAFQFQTPADRHRFHRVINAYAKRDSKNEVNLIRESWWQPFYYTNEALAGFEPIALVVLSDGNFEATLTVLEERLELVRQAMQGSALQHRVDRVWVNPAFFRFLNGDYK